ncbi:MAG: DUF6687 family protein [Myxococcales bacterium]
MRIWIAGGSIPRPDSTRTAFVDARPGAGFRPGVDVELSHRFGNQTPRHFRGDTATAICLRFADAYEKVDLAVNDHLDVDGVLALMSLQDPATALAHRRTLLQAAEMGAFFGWGEPPAQELYQGLALFLAGLRGLEPTLAAGRAIDRARTLLAPAQRPELLPGLRALQRSVRLLDRGDVRRRTWGARFVHYEIPFSLTGPTALHVPAHGEPFSDACLLWPHARARLDRDRITLLTVGVRGGWAHELWYPGYAWSDAPQSWRPPAIEETGAFFHAPLSAALLRLQAIEQGDGAWMPARRLALGEGLRGFPIAAGFLRDGAPAASTVKPDVVAQILSGAF